jgi:hypothetical protein
MTGDRAFWVDVDFDREHAAAGGSRFDAGPRSSRTRELNDPLSPMIGQIEAGVPADS